MNVSALLDRLDGARQSGPGRWMAECPAHEDRRPSLSIRERDDGAVLLHCFGGCDTESVVGAVGLQMSDLFPPRDPRVESRAACKSRIPASDALAAIDHEAHVVAVIAADVAEHREIDAPTWQRLAHAAHRIGEARSVVTPLRIKR
jgi:hypothetical protein